MALQLNWVKMLTFGIIAVEALVIIVVLVVLVYLAVQRYGKHKDFEDRDN